LILKVAVLGGYGAMAQVVVRDLLDSPEIRQVGICGRSEKKAKAFADQLGDLKVYPVGVDVTDRSRLSKVIRDFDVVVNASWYEYNLEVMKTAITSRVSYVDLGGLYNITLEQLKLNEEAIKAGVTCLLGMGSTPGTMNVMAAYAASKLDHVEKVKLRSGYKTVSGKTKTFQTPYSFRTVLDEFTKPAPILRDGKILTMPPLSGKERFTLPEPVGEVEGYFTIHSELATLPANIGKGVNEMDFIVAYEPDFTGTLNTLLNLGLAEKEKKVSVNGAQVTPFEFLLATVDSLPKGTVLDVDIQEVEMVGKKNDEELRLRCDAITFPHKRWNIGGGTVDTGIPPSIGAQWIASGKIKMKGVVPPELCVDPLPYFRELNLRDRGIKVYEDFVSKKCLSC
jgi:lysine 6-dehydrogenase